MPFDVVCCKRDVVIIRVVAKFSLLVCMIDRVQNDFLAAISFMSSYNEVPCHLLCEGCYSTLLSAVHKANTLITVPSMSLFHVCLQ